MSACLAFLHKLRKHHCVLTDCKLTHDSRCETRVKLKHYKIFLCVHNYVIWLVNRPHNRGDFLGCGLLLYVLRKTLERFVVLLCIVKFVKREHLETGLLAPVVLVVHMDNSYIKAVADAVKINAHAYMIVKKHITLHLLNLRENFLCESSLLCESFFCHNSKIYWLILREAQNLPF